MAKFELKLPKMGVSQKQLLQMVKEVGDKIEADEAVLEQLIIDSEVPSEVSGILVEQLFAKDDLVSGANYCYY
jgi:2-oxoglutarate dehydrogenase E2 component (dihydrolipoamide succinyltransferase)